ncbi:MAG: GMC family oxidoreductase [Phycisphaerales bacterium]|nr:GMC family oxidoreductase [Phycisphaerales bacterium]
MLLDLESADSPQRYDADLCIIGAGAAGITMSRRLIGSGLDVLVLEAGGFEFEPATQDLYNGAVRGLYYSVVGSRLRRFGGTTNHWEGWCGPLPQTDLSPRAWVPRSGWPIGYGDLEPYYRLACEVLELGEYDFDTFGDIKPPAPSVTPKGAPFFESFGIRPTPVPRLGATHRGMLTEAGNVRVLLHANVLPIAVEGGQVRQITVSTLGKRQATVRAKVFVLACGGLENARMLLASGNLANSSDAVGRHFMDHTFSTFAGVVVPPNEYSDSPTYRAREGIPPYSGLRVSPEAEKELEIMACSIGVIPHAIPDSLKPPGPRGIEIGFPMMIHGECTPLPESRVTLTPEIRDAMGTPRLMLDWRVDEMTQRTVRETVLRYSGMITRAGLGRVYIPQEQSELEWPFALYAPCHPAGTTRMSSDPKLGVVNADCRTHDVPNLYVVGNSVFSTISHMNPTMTIVALSFRLADHLQVALGKK